MATGTRSVRRRRVQRHLGSDVSGAVPEEGSVGGSPKKLSVSGASRNALALAGSRSDWVPAEGPVSRAPEVSQSLST